MGFSSGSDGKESACNVGDSGSILGSGRSLEKEMAIHSSVLAWKIPWPKEPGRLQSRQAGVQTGSSLEKRAFPRRCNFREAGMKDLGFSSGSEGKETACNVGDSGLILGSGRPPGEGNGNPLQSSCLENPMARGAWQATVQTGRSPDRLSVCRESDTTVHFHLPQE